MSQNLLLHSVTLKSGDHIGWLYDHISGPVSLKLCHCFINIHDMDIVPVQKFGADTCTCPRSVYWIFRICVMQICFDLFDCLFSCFCITCTETDNKNCCFFRYPHFRSPYSKYSYSYLCMIKSIRCQISNLLYRGKYGNSRKIIRRRR